MISKLLQHISNFIKSDDIEEDKILSYFTPKKFNKKEFLFKENDRNISHYFVVKGCLRLYFIDNNGVEQTLQFAIENWWITDYTAFNNQVNSDFSLQAVEEVEVLGITIKDEELLLSEFPILEKYFKLIYQKAYSASQYKFRYQTEFTREEQYRHFLQNFPEFAKRIPQTYLASYLNMTPEYFSKIKKDIGLR